jgi:hypothetical protein
MMGYKIWNPCMVNNEAEFENASFTQQTVDTGRGDPYQVYNLVPEWPFFWFWMIKDLQKKFFPNNSSSITW